MWRSYKAETPELADETQEVDLNLHDSSESDHEGRQSRSASITSSTSAPASNDVTLQVPITNSSATSPTPSTGSMYFIAGMFDGKEKVNREQPPMPTTDGVEYPRAASWAAGNCANVLNDDKGKQLFRVFLFQSLAEENLAFLEAMEKLKKMKISDEKVAYAKEILETYQGSINLSSSSMKSLRNAVASETLDMEEFAPAIKEVRRLLENDQFPRFRRSELYLEYLEELLPRSYAEKWAQSFEGLLGNHVGRHHFRIFLRSIHAEENLRFWEAVVEFRSSRHKANAMNNLGKVILSTYLAEGTTNEVFLPFGVRQVIERRIQDNQIDITLFDEAIKHVEQVLRNDPYVRFLQSSQYIDLLSKLK
ncbi:Regulator of G-protein signaling rgs-3 [Caenorhabditis elegans]|uniref:Regulator of G-protein signaling rgs-3 n=3 Tax=Caenorhabditis elegans TaxID=6239 RepID=RGS3_CAEEL|nr:Regulator of G-protein signaling rgs-3 [Caenorhabditis elegans]Q18312.2 RecName: Full=Regulator of G-protein signaling rgs-3 [Caenorhabditis elegans]CCD66106.1 Regulator of G-protein signaling rgs-3 [Caenorhabditis elegans]|eukprot:NP_495223.1 Regulator of G-protein signaling rgs-3 [Caenorhabditis elegans]